MTSLSPQARAELRALLLELAASYGPNTEGHSLPAHAMLGALLACAAEPAQRGVFSDEVHRAAGVPTTDEWLASRRAERGKP